MTRDELRQWAAQWGASIDAADDLLARLAAATVATEPAPPAVEGKSEAAVQAWVRLSLARTGGRAWRNNVGALMDSRGVPVRYGLANDSRQVNDRIKSADLIGINPIAIGPEHVGTVIGQFWSRECKAAGWKYSGSEREQAQLRWAELVRSLGGDAGFTTGR